MKGYMFLDNDRQLIRVEVDDSSRQIRFFKGGAKANILTVDEQKELRERARDDGFMAGLVAATALGKPTSTEPEYGVEYVRIDEHNERMEKEYKRGYKDGKFSMKSEILSKIEEISPEILLF